MAGEPYDLILAGGTVVDGTGRPGFRADVALAGDRIAAVGALAGAAGPRIDVAGLVVAPGFIDVHTHDDAALVEAPEMTMKVSQGVTTVVTGNCGVSAAPHRGEPTALSRLVFRSDRALGGRMAEFMGKVEAARPALNAACLVGHTTLRSWAMGEDLGRAADGAEIAEMRARLEEALADGAIGLSSGLFYPPANAAPLAEVAAVAAPLGAAGALYTAHIRDEAAHVVAALEEAFEIGRLSGAATVISHHKCMGAPNFGRSPETLAVLERAMARQKVAFDVYPYDAGSTRLLNHMIAMSDRVMITNSDPFPQHAGRWLADVAAEMGVTQEVAADRLQPAGAIYFLMDERDVRRILAHPQAMIGSDGIPGGEHPHPRLWGTFPRVLGHYARDLGLFGLEEAVRRMTALSADNFGLTGRGRVAAGAYADLAVFDPATIADRATYEKPVQPAAGIHLVLVNGRVVLRDGRATGERPGRVLRRQAMQAERAA